MGVQGLLVAVLVGMVQGRFVGVFLRVSGEAVGSVAVVGRFFVVAFFQVLSRGPVVLQCLLEVMSRFFVGLNDFLVLFGVVSHGK